jgi:enoyl-[acyl-carrier protein] reductase II
MTKRSLRSYTKRDNRITRLFGIRYPIIQAGMIWCSGWELASAVSNAGGLGIIGAGSMSPEILREHIHKCKASTAKPFGVNIPLLYHGVGEQVNVILEEGVKIVITSAGNPAKWVPFLKQHGILVAHVIANVRSALKCRDAGADAIVAEGFEAGGHVGREETTTFTLLPLVRAATDMPMIAAGGIATGRGMLAAMALGADAIQIGTRFAASVESSAHPEFKRKIIESVDGDTTIALKKLVAVRLLKNSFFEKVRKLEDECAIAEELQQLLGKGRARLGMFEGETSEGELEAGQVAALIKEIKPAEAIIREILEEFASAKDELREQDFSL